LRPITAQTERISIQLIISEEDEEAVRATKMRGDALVTGDAEVPGLSVRVKAQPQESKTHNFSPHLTNIPHLPPNLPASL